MDPREAFCTEQFPRLVGALGLYTGDAELAEELAQDALARALLHWDRVEHADSPGAYVHGIAMNLAGSYFRRRRAVAAPPAPDPHRATRALRATLDSEEGTRVR